MKNTITRVDALNLAITALTDAYMSDEAPDTLGVNCATCKNAVEVLTNIRDQIAKPRKTSDEAKAARSAKTAAARAELVAKVAPVLRKFLTADITAKELFEAAKAELPEDFSAPKVQNILIREMAPELVKTEVKGKANTYRLA